MVYTLGPYLFSKSNFRVRVSRRWIVESPFLNCDLVLLSNLVQILMVKRAEGEAESKYLSGVGVARQRQVIMIIGLRESGSVCFSKL